MNQGDYDVQIFLQVSVIVVSRGGFSVRGERELHYVVYGSQVKFMDTVANSKHILPLELGKHQSLRERK